MGLETIYENRILKVLREADGEPLRQSEILEAMGASNSRRAWKALTRLVERGLVSRDSSLPLVDARGKRVPGTSGYYYTYINRAAIRETGYS